MIQGVEIKSQFEITYKFSYKLVQITDIHWLHATKADIYKFPMTLTNSPYYLTIIIVM